MGTHTVVIEYSDGTTAFWTISEEQVPALEECLGEPDSIRT